MACDDPHRFTGFVDAQSDSHSFGTNSQANAPFEFQFESIGELSLTGISVKGVYRANQFKQGQILSIVDLSAQSDKQPIMFCGDLLNIHLGARLALDSEANLVDPDMLSECLDLFSTLDHMRGFPPSQVMFCSSPSSLVDKTMNLAKTLLQTAQLPKHFQHQQGHLQVMGQHRLFQPVLNTVSPKVQKAIELLGLDPENPAHVIRSLWAMREQLPST